MILAPEHAFYPYVQLIPLLHLMLLGSMHIQSCHFEMDPHLHFAHRAADRKPPCTATQYETTLSDILLVSRDLTLNAGLAFMLAPEMEDDG